VSEQLGQILPPTEDDGKPVYVMSPSTEGLYTWLTARGDDLNPTPPDTGRGKGSKMLLEFTEPGYKEVEIQWSEPVELHDGHVNWNPADWDFDDEWNVGVRIPATEVTPNATNEGACNLIEIPGTGGTMHVIVHADGDGTHDFVGGKVPVPCGVNEPGYWALLDRFTEEMSPQSAPVNESWNLYDFPIEMYLIRNLNCGDPRGVWDLDAYKAEWISSKWKLIFSCTRVSAGAGRIGGFVMLFRPNAV